MGERNLHLSHFYFIGQFMLLSSFYAKVLKGERLISIIKIIGFFGVTFSIGYYALYPQGFLQWNVFEITITSIPILIYSFIFFTQNIEIKSTKYFIYFNSGLFIYLLSSTLLFTLGNIGLENEKMLDIKRLVWKFHSMLYIVYQLLIFIEWYKNVRKPISNKG